jgi:hypothetical protein
VQVPGRQLFCGLPEGRPSEVGRLSEACSAGEDTHPGRNGEGGGWPCLELGELN